MKKTLVAIAALAAVSAFAQSTAVISGEINFAYQKDTDTTKGLVLADNSIRVSLSEDLGGGLKASAFTQFTGNSTRGGGLTKEDSALSLAGNFGTLQFASTRSTTLAVNSFVAPTWLSDNMYGGIQKVYARVPVDLLQYTTPKFGAFTGYYQFVESSNDGAGNPANKTNAIGLNYANGPLVVMGRYLSTSGFAANIRDTSFDGAATYDFGVAKIGFGYDSKRRGVAKNSATEKAATSFGVVAPLGAITVGANFAKRGDSKISEAVVQYNLSKRTALNASFGSQKGDTGGSESQYRIGVKHTF